MSSASSAPGDADAPADRGPLIQGGRLGRVLGAIEVLGNRLPHPFWLFALLAALIVPLSELLARMGASAVDPTTGETVAVTSLLNGEGLRRIVAEVVPNVVEFPPLGVVLVVMLGVAVADGAGLITTALRIVVAKVPARWLTFVLALAGVTGSIASDAITVVLIPLGAAAFKAAGRSAVLGAVVAFASASAGFNASLVVNLTDPLLGGISTSAAQLVDPDYQVSPIANYYFSAASAVMLALLITFVTERVLTRMTARIHEAELAAERDGTAEVGDEDDENPQISQENLRSYQPQEIRGLRWAGLASVVYVALYFLALLLPFSPLRGLEETGALSSVLITDISGPIALLFLVAGIAYGIPAGTIRCFADVPELMARGLRDIAGLLVLLAAAAQFIAFFTWTGMGTVIAIRGSDLLEAAGLPLPLLFFCVVLVVAVLNLVLTSGSAQYTLVAPVIVPMFMYLGVNPETTQMLYRIGDSSFNIITPLNAFFVLTLGVVQQRLQRAGIGTLMSLLLPFALSILVVWFLFFLLWWSLGIPLGPGAPAL
ncbi:AbgT family transporter [Kocuria sp. p3-SID1433]|uniref:AbgT family transporter n=1 Tax=unclassified Kocuria TaxID=2649579 RepID=UPI0021A2EEF0|nr:MULTISPECIES: AbgT family transporter [unclassified Kocuria]MCT1601954.1 AbgT family transporter [Kocuria sp. p3-SID1428]MCT2180959.1 AbgT family transporter [Kocuria sp. p3-SID1433]